MNLYEPYTEMDSEDSILHLKLSLQDRLLSVLASRIIPLLIIILMFLTFIISDITLTGWILAALIFIIASTLIILNTKTGTELFFKDKEIEIWTLRFRGTKKETILLKDAASIELEIFMEPRVSGAYYRLVLKNGKRILLLKFPEFLNYDKKRFRELNLSLNFITTLRVDGDLAKLE